jgi:hypothetical protein
MTRPPCKLPPYREKQEPYLNLENANFTFCPDMSDLSGLVPTDVPCCFVNDHLNIAAQLGVDFMARPFSAAGGSYVALASRP